MHYNNFALKVDGNEKQGGGKEHSNSGSVWHCGDRGLFATSGFLPRVRARAHPCAPVFLGSLTFKTGALRAPPPIAALLLLIYPPKLSEGAYIFPLG
jgi:hypothetical protein